MSEEAKEAPEGDSTDSLIKNTLKTLQDDLQAKLNSDDQKFDRLAKKIDSLSEPRGEPEKTSEWNLDEEDADAYISKKEMLALLDRQTQAFQSTLDKAVNKKIDERDERNLNANLAIQETLRDIPQLNQNSPEFDQNFYKDVSKEMERRVDSGRSKNDINLFSDSANYVYREYARKGLFKNRRAAEQERMEDSKRRDGSYSFTAGFKPNANGKLNERQIAFAKQLGMNLDKLKQRVENIK